VKVVTTMNKKKTVLRKILESIGYIIGIFAIVALGSAFVRWAGGNDRYVLVIGAIAIVSVLIKIWKGKVWP